MTTNDVTNQVERAKFLWDKWKHHDTLAYGRVQQYLQLNAFIGAAAALLWVRGHACLTIAPLILGSLCGLFYFRMFVKDLKVRNSFNLALVDSLSQAGIIQFQDDVAERERWTSSDNGNAFNRWHVCPVEHERAAGQSSLEAQWVIGAVALLQFLAALGVAAFVVYRMQCVL